MIQEGRLGGKVTSIYCDKQHKGCHGWEEGERALRFACEEGGEGNSFQEAKCVGP